MMGIKIVQIEIYKLIRHPMTFTLISLCMGLLALLFYRLCLDYLHMAHQALHHRQVQASLYLEVIKPFCSWSIIILAIAFPLFTTYTFSQEIKQRTFYLWASSAIKASQLVLGKWLSLMLILLFILLMIFIMISTLMFTVALNWPMIALCLLNVGLVGCCFISLGLFVSSLTTNPLFSLGVTYLGVLCWMLFEWLNPLGQKYALFAKQISLLSHSYRGLNGLFYSPDIFFFMITSGLFLCLTQRRVKYLLTRVVR